MLAYDLIGFQTEEDCENFLSYCAADLGLVSAWRRRAFRAMAGRALRYFRSASIRSRFAAAGRQGVDPSGRVAAAAQPERREARDRRRPAGLFQGPRSTASRRSTGCGRLHPSADALGVAAADRNAVARRDRGLRQSAERRREAGQRRQRPARRGRLDADPLSQQGLTARPCSRVSIAPRRSAW